MSSPLGLAVDWIGTEYSGVIGLQANIREWLKYRKSFEWCSGDPSLVIEYRLSLDFLGFILEYLSDDISEQRTSWALSPFVLR